MAKKQKFTAATANLKKAKAAQPAEIVVEGDSWEHLPDFGLKSLPIVGGSNYDLSRALSARGHIVHNLAYWGDTIAAIEQAGDYLNALRHTKARWLLLGGGGNDLLGGGNLKTYLRLFAPELTAKEYILDVFYRDLRRVMLCYDRILAKLAADSALKKVRVIVHGYDYAKPMKLGWIGEPMAFVGINDHMPELQQAIVNVLIDALNEELTSLAKRHANVVRLDFRGQVKGRWHDELHPTRAAFEDLARLVEQQLV